MFGVIIYLPLFMQGVLGVSATRSGNLLTPLMMGAVDRQHRRRTDAFRGPASTRRRDRRIGPGGRRHDVSSRSMDAATPRMSVVYGDDHRGPRHGPAAAGLHDRRAERRAARDRWAPRPRRRSSFRSIGSTVGVAAFGSMMLTRYHRDFAQSMPAHVPPVALPYFSNPLLLVQIRPQLDAAFGRVPGGAALLQTLVHQRENLAHERPAPDLRLQRDHHGPGGPAAPAAAERAVSVRASSSYRGAVDAKGATDTGGSYGAGLQPARDRAALAGIAIATLPRVAPTCQAAGHPAYNHPGRRRLHDLPNPSLAVPHVGVRGRNRTRAPRKRRRRGRTISPRSPRVTGPTSARRTSSSAPASAPRPTRSSVWPG